MFDVNGGLASEADYPYIGVTNYCNTTRPVVKFKKVCCFMYPKSTDCTSIWIVGRSQGPIPDSRLFSTML